jgi:hypothetical protein
MAYTMQNGCEIWNVEYYESLQGNSLKTEASKLAKYKLDLMAVWNKEEFPLQWKEFIIVPVYKKGNKTDHSNYRVISLLPSACKFYPVFFFQG